MNKLRTLAILSACLLIFAGCANQYLITTNSTTYRTKSKPVLNEKGYYVFKDGSGKTVELNAMRVRSIEAVSSGESNKLPFQR
jgi:hypothetical protein